MGTHSVTFAPGFDEPAEEHQRLVSGSRIEANTPPTQACSSACQAQVQFLEQRVEEVRKQAYASYRREMDLESRVKALSSLLNSFGERLQPDLQQELARLLEGALPEEQLALEDNADHLEQVAISDSDCDSDSGLSDDDPSSAKFEPTQVMDFPLSQTEKLKRLHQLYQCECSAAEQEARRLKKGKSTYKSALRRVSQSSGVTAVTALRQSRGGGGIQDFAQQAQHLEDVLRRRSVVEPEVESSARSDRQAASQEPMALANVAHWSDRSVSVFKEFWPWSSADDEA